jgi:hypothetical protein
MSITNHHTTFRERQSAFDRSKIGASIAAQQEAFISLKAALREYILPQPSLGQAARMEPLSSIVPRGNNIYDLRNEKISYLKIYRVLASPLQLHFNRKNVLLPQVLWKCASPASRAA